jgi:hypothetical protein
MEMNSPNRAIAGISRVCFAFLCYALERATTLTGVAQRLVPPDSISHYDTIIFPDLHLIIIYSDNTPRMY